MQTRRIYTATKFTRSTAVKDALARQQIGSSLNTSHAPIVTQQNVDETTVTKLLHAYDLAVAHAARSREIGS